MRKLEIVAALAVSSLLWAGPISAATSLSGQVLSGGAPIANSTVTLWVASASAPKELAHAQTGTDGRFALSGNRRPEPRLALSISAFRQTLAVAAPIIVDQGGWVIS